MSPSSQPPAPTCTSRPQRQVGKDRREGVLYYYAGWNERVNKNQLVCFTWDKDQQQLFTTCWSYSYGKEDCKSSTSHFLGKIDCYLGMTKNSQKGSSPGFSRKIRDLSFIPSLANPFSFVSGDLTFAIFGMSHEAPAPGQPGSVSSLAPCFWTVLYAPS